MAKVKYQTKGFSLFEYRNVEEHLSKMAAKGWRLEKIGPYFWKYRKSEPKQVAYAVTYVPEASEYNPGPTPEQVTLEWDVYHGPMPLTVEDLLETSGPWSSIWRTTIGKIAVPVTTPATTTLGERTVPGGGMWTGKK